MSQNRNGNLAGYRHDYVGEIDDLAARDLPPCEPPERTSREHLTAEARTLHEAKLRDPDREDADDAPLPAIVSAAALLRTERKLHPPVIHGLLREGEVGNIIAPPKSHKSFLVMQTGLHIAVGKALFGMFETVPGRVLFIDNELHEATIRHRLPDVATGCGITRAEFELRVDVLSLRGRLTDLHKLGKIIYQIPPGTYRAVFIDAWYRSIPEGVDENDNAAVCGLYNLLDSYAAHLRSAIICVHHTSKGSQLLKGVTDMGSGAGAQSRAPDAHLVLKQHQNPDCMVLDGVVRSWAPIQPLGLRWVYPTWLPAPDIDVTALAGARKKKEAEDKTKKPPPRTWSPEQFAAEFVAQSPAAKEVILSRAARAEGLSQAKARGLLAEASAAGIIHRHTFHRDNKAYFATQEQSLLESSVCVSRPPTPPVGEQVATGAEVFSAHTADPKRSRKRAPRQKGKPKQQA